MTRWGGGEEQVRSVFLAASERMSRVSKQVNSSLRCFHQPQLIAHLMSLGSWHCRSAPTSCCTMRGDSGGCSSSHLPQPSTHHSQRTGLVAH